MLRFLKSMPDSGHKSAPRRSAPQVFSYLISAHGMADPRTGEAAIPGRRTDKVGGGTAQPALRRPLDEAPEEELSYAVLARACRSRAAEAVARWASEDEEGSDRFLRKL